jgi:hypothetical protein
MPFNKNMALRQAFHSKFALDTFPKITTYMAMLLGQPVRPIYRLVIYFRGRI